MTTQPTLAEARKMQEADVEKYRKLQRDKLSATPDQKVHICDQIEAVLATIRKWDTTIQELLKAR